MTDSVESGRRAFARREWGEAYAQLTAAPDLGAADVERLAVAAYLVGRDDESQQAWERAQVEHVREHDPASAARCAFWLGLLLRLGGHGAQADGWLARAERLAGDAGQLCAASGFVLVGSFLDLLWTGAADAALARAEEMIDIAHACHDPELLAFGLLCRGEALIAQGDTKPGMKAFDEAMVSVTTGDVSPMHAGILYCAVIEACVDAHDLQRAAEWTEELDRWCAAQPDLVPYRGACLVHRSQVMQARGAWTEAAVEAEQARRRLGAAQHPAVGIAWYQLGELHRLRGDSTQARRAYEAASEHGHEPDPGLALLRLADGDVAGAVGAVERMLEESRGLRTHATRLAAAVEVLLEAGKVQEARAASDELDRLAGPAAAPQLRAVVDYATGSVRLAEGDAAAALAPLRRAAAAFRDLELPFDAARTRVRIALAYRSLGDDGAADLELDAARTVFERLGARPDLARLTELARTAGDPPDGLSQRECEVLRLVATGVTNREAAAALHISEHTVARHLQNIFAKLGLSSRAAATAYAHTKGLA